MHEENGEAVLEGLGRGHGIGRCQRGAGAMAESGAGFQEILENYFPNTARSRSRHIPSKCHSPSVQRL
jgi:SpoIID/LytB domain protein